VSDAGVSSTVGIGKEASGSVAVAGLGDTDYGDDYRAARSGVADYVAPDALTLGRTAVERAIADGGLSTGDVDGLCVSFPYGGPAPEDFAAELGLKPALLMRGQGMMPFMSGVEAVATGRAETLVIVHSLPSRATNRQYGGATYGGGGRDSYYYYHPWGWSSQAAHWALMFSHYQANHGSSEADLGGVATTLRANARRNPNAIMRAPMDVDAYLSSRYIVRPMRLFDMCLVNDGAVALVLTSTARARDLPHTPVLVSGWADTFVEHSKMHYMVRERLRPQLAEAAERALGIAGIGIGDIDHFEGYDASTIHLINQLEGYGFVEPGEGLAFWNEGNTALGGKLPVNTSGGMLSESYLQGWNLIAECVRQLRHENGERQIAGVERSLFSFATTGSAHPVVFTRGA
jgi:acetyl-CoA acetyltransferase